MKRYILSLFLLGAVFVSCFGYCQNIYSIFESSSSFTLSPSNNNKEFGIGQCVFSTCTSSCNNFNNYLHFYTSSGGELGEDLGTGRWNQYMVHCFDFTGFLHSDYSSNLTNMRIANLVNFQNFCTGSSSDCPACEECQECPVCDDSLYITFTNGGMSPLNYTVSGHEINVELPFSSSGYFVSYSSVGGFNDFVVDDLSPGCSLDCDDLSGLNWSALYINNIQHLSTPIIHIDIPEEISWDYTSDDEEFNLIVSGYNVDTEYIENIIKLQNTKPTKTDLNSIITNIIPLFVPGLVIILFIYFVFRSIKKLF